MTKTRQDLIERLQAAMRTAIRKHPRAKLWAKANCQDNFALAVLSTARDAALDVILNAFDTGSKEVKRDATEWMNEQVGTTLDRFVLTTCREMYKLLRV